MRAVVIAFAVLIAGISASPQKLQQVVDQTSGRLVADIVVSLIEEYSRRVYERGLDPYRNDYVFGRYVLHIDDIFEVSGWVRNIALDGIGKVDINGVGFDGSTGTLSFDLAYPAVSGSVSAAEGEIIIFGYSLSAVGSGSLTINNVGVAGSVKLGLSLFDGIVVESIDVVLSVGSVESNLSLDFFGYDISDTVNNALSNTIPAAIETYQEEISLTIEYFILPFLNRVL